MDIFLAKERMKAVLYYIVCNDWTPYMYTIIPQEYLFVMDDVTLSLHVEPRVVYMLVQDFIYRFGTDTIPLELHMILTDAILEWKMESAERFERMTPIAQKAIFAQ